MRFFSDIGSVTYSIVVILLVALLWRLLTFEDPQPVGYDEAAYRYYAQLIGDRGLEGFRAMVRAWPHDEFFNKAPLPYRVGYLLPCVGICKLLGGYTTFNLAILSLVFGVGTAVVALLLARRWVGPAWGFLTALLVVFSPLGTFLSRRALQDTYFAFVVAVSLLFFDRCWRERRRADAWLLGASLLVGFLTKESMAFLYPAYMLTGLCYARDGWRDKLHIAIPFLVAPLAYLAIVVWLSGGVQDCLNTYRSYAAMQNKIPYALEYQNGPWFRYLVDLMLLSPLTTVLALLGLTAPVRNARVALVFLLAAFAVMSIITILNVRLILFLDPCLRLFAVLGVVALCLRVPVEPRIQCVIALLLVALVIGGDVFQFHRIFDGARVPDPITAELFRANGFRR